MYDHIAMDVPLSHPSISMYGFVVISWLFDFFNIRGGITIRETKL
jgi:hypothetical protein